MLSVGKINVLLVEDSPGDARLVQLMLKGADGFRIEWKERLKDATTYLEKNSVAAVLLDLSLPDSSGFDTLRSTREAAPATPIVIFTGLEDEEFGLKAVQEGAQDYLVKGQGDENLVRRTIKYAIERMASEQERREHAERMKKTLMQTVDAVSLTLEMRDPYTAGHQERVARLAVEIGKRLRLGEDALDGLKTGALIHDIGKINVPADFLNRPGQLSDAAFGIIKAHPQVGYDIVRGIDFPWPVASMILQHHERLDGTGYPNGITGGDIILESRILAVADVVEAISSHRPYRPSLGLGAALDEIRNGMGLRYDSEVVTACEEVIKNGQYSVPPSSAGSPFSMST